MVQRKASNKLAGCPKEPRNRGGGGGGGGAEGFTMKVIPNYMKPTSSSDARVARSQVTPAYPQPSSNSSSSLMRTSKSKPTRATWNKQTRATCSSTLKNSKFPNALELHPGATEAEGTSALRVCPCSYCSLNGHWHEPLPPLKSFMTARRKLLNTHKSFKQKGHPLFKVKGSLKDEKERDDDFFVEIYGKVKDLQDVEVDNLGESVTQNNFDHKDEYCSAIHLGDDSDKNSDLSAEEMESIMNLIEYVECGSITIETQEGNHPCLVPEVKEKTIIPALEVTSVNYGEDEGLAMNNKSNCLEFLEDGLCPISLPSPEKESSADILPFEPSSNLCDTAETDTKQFIELCQLCVEMPHELTKQNSMDGSPDHSIFSDNTELEDDSHDGGIGGLPAVYDESDKRNNNIFLFSSRKEHEEGSDVPVTLRNCTKQDCPEIDEATQTDKGDNIEKDDILFLSCNDTTKHIAINAATAKTIQSLIDTADVHKSRMRITRTRTAEEPEQMKEFNPRSPRFLDLEPEPGAEKVDLRHQMADERKNAEDWMIDYALQRALSKLEPTRKKKVALLVKAFETVKPLSISEGQLQYATSGFAESRIIQPCS